MTEEQIKSLQSTGGDHLAATEKNILGNHLNQLWEGVRDLRDKTGGRIDFILDNAGFELYCDCVYGSYDTFSDAELSESLFSRLPHPEWLGEANSFPWQAIPLVCFGCDEEGLGMASQHYGLWPPLPEGN
jgi:hypothetical protein